MYMCMYMYMYTSCTVHCVICSIFIPVPTTPLYFDPAKTQFKDVSDIHPALLQDIVNCYKKYKYVCRTCFVRYNRQEIIVGGKPCRKCRNTTTTRIVPASKMCKNFRDLRVLAIPPPPKVLMAPTNRHKPFLYCRNVDHLLCYDRAKESWYAHSMDELVIWTVERHWRESHMTLSSLSYYIQCSLIILGCMQHVHVYMYD